MNHFRLYHLTCFLLFLLMSITAFAQDPLPVRNDTAIYSPSPIMGEQRTLWIHLPADYYTTNNTYPVLYLLDGDTHFSYASQMTDFLAGHDRNRIPQMIVIGIVNVDRQRDFSPVYAKKSNGSLDSSQIVPNTGLGRFAHYIKNEVIPYIDSHYRVQPYRILEAHSLAGLPAMYTKESDPQLFAAMVLISPVLSGPLVRNLDAFLKADHPHNGKLFIGIGNENTSAVDALIKRIHNQAPDWFEWANANYPEENHFTVPYKTLFDGIKFIYRDWFLDYYGNESITMPDIDNRFKKMSAEFGYSIAPKEEYLNDCGYYQLRLKHIDNAIGIFEENVRRHPDSFNTYDSLGEAYMNAGNKTLAIKNYEKSVELNPHNDGGKQMLQKLRSGK